MTGFADLVTQAQPAIYGGGAPIKVTEGKTWSWTFTDVTDTAGAAIDLTSVTGTCVVWDTAGADKGTVGTVVLTLTFTGGSGTFTVSAAKAATAGLASGKKNGRACVWGLKLDNGTASVQVWGPSNSPILILDEDGVA